MNATTQSDPLSMLNKAMNAESDWVIRMVYKDKAGKRTRRVVSPIRFIDPENMLALCLGREEPRRFELERCSELELVNANEVLMPVDIEIIDEDE